VRCITRDKHPALKGIKNLFLPMTILVFIEVGSIKTRLSYGLKKQEPNKKICLMVAVLPPERSFILSQILLYTNS